MGERDAGVKAPVGFELGRLYATPGAMRAIEEADAKLRDRYGEVGPRAA